MAEFQETARLKIRELSSKNAATRRDAAYYLGEAGVDEAIRKLADLYRADPDASVRKAAQYALGMFRAVDIALKRGEEEKVLSLLRQVVDEGKLGKRLAVPVRAIVRLELLLLVVLVGLLALYAYLPGKASSNGNTPVNEAQALADLRQTYQLVRDDALNLEQEFRNVVAGGSLNCAAYFNDPQPYTLPDAIAQANPALAGAAAEINNAQASVAAGRASFEAACNNVDPLEVSEVGPLLTPLLALQASLPDVEPVLNPPATEIPPTVMATAQPQNSPVPPTAQPAPTDVPAPAVSVPVADPRAHLVPLYAILEVRLPREAHGLLDQYWRDASVGATDACTDPHPDIPDDYVAPARDLQASADLREAVEQINLGLSLVREGWDLFAQACASGNFRGEAPAGMQIVGTAEQAFATADAALLRLRSSE